MAMRLEVSNLSVARGGVTVLQNVNFSLSPGQVKYLRGPNGTGKTTLLRCLAGLQPAEAGVVNVNQDLIEYAAHNDGIKPGLTVAENLGFWASLSKTERVDEALAAFGVSGLKARLAGRLSQGQKRRVGLARLLVGAGKIWLLDEPTVSLDQASVSAFASVLSSHISHGGSALIATHIDVGVAGEDIDMSAFKPVVGQSELDLFAGQSEAFL